MWKKGILEGKSIGIQLLALVATAFLLTILVNTVLLIVASFIASIRFIPLNDYLKTVDFMKMLQLFSTISMFLLPALLIARWSSRHPFSFLSIDRYPQKPVLILALASIVAVLPFLNLMAGWFTGWHFPSWMGGLERWIDEMNRQNEVLLTRFLDVRGVGALLFNIVLMAVVPAVSEELFFRGAVQRILSGKLNVHFSVWITAAVFSFVHLEFTGFLPRMLLGAYFGYLLYATGSVWVPVAAHFINNTIGVVLSYLYFNHTIGSDADHWGCGDTAWMGWLGAALFGAFLYLIIRIRKRGLTDGTLA
jgi:membrane protease YdiL (CAAX protease family)